MNYNQKYLNKILKCNDISKVIRENLDELTDLIPEIHSMIGFDHKHPHHHLDVMEHTIFALSVSPNNFDIRLALLLHDIGKPHSYQEDGGIRHFKGHPEMSAEMSRKILKRLGFDDAYSEKISTSIELHDTPLRGSFILDNTELANLIFEIQKCDVLAHNPKFNNKRLKYIDDLNQLFVTLAIPQEYLNEYNFDINPEK